MIIEPKGVGAASARVSELRRAFDGTFAKAIRTAGGEAQEEDLLAVRIFTHAYAIRVAEIAGIITSRKIVPVPSRRFELLGVAGLRGGLIPVYHLGALLGHGSPD